MYTLVIVDVQEKFISAHSMKVINNCRREIRRAIRFKAPIIFLEFDGFGHTLAELTILTNDYKNAYFANKLQNNGSAEVGRLIADKNLPHDTRVAGVNTSYCVLETVVGLTYFHGSVSVIADACNCREVESHTSGLSRLHKMAKELSNMKVIHDTAS